MTTFNPVKPPKNPISSSLYLMFLFMLHDYGIIPSPTPSPVLGRPPHTLPEPSLPLDLVLSGFGLWMLDAVLDVGLLVLDVGFQAWRPMEVSQPWRL